MLAQPPRVVYPARSANRSAVAGSFAISASASDHRSSGTRSRSRTAVIDGGCSEQPGPPALLVVQVVVGRGGPLLSDGENPHPTPARRRTSPPNRSASCSSTIAKGRSSARIAASGNRPAGVRRRGRVRRRRRAAAVRAMPQLTGPPRGRRPAGRAPVGEIGDLVVGPVLGGIGQCRDEVVVGQEFTSPDRLGTQPFQQGCTASGWTVGAHGAATPAGAITSPRAPGCDVRQPWGRAAPEFLGVGAAHDERSQRLVELRPPRRRAGRGRRRPRRCRPTRSRGRRRPGAPHAAGPDTSGCASCASTGPGRRPTRRKIGDDECVPRREVVSPSAARTHALVANSSPMDSRAGRRRCCGVGRGARPQALRRAECPYQCDVARCERADVDAGHEVASVGRHRQRRDHPRGDWISMSVGVGVRRVSGSRYSRSSVAATRPPTLVSRPSHRVPGYRLAPDVP